jgi:pimeloyl-ACP methyl ester carboxylesterase
MRCVTRWGSSPGSAIARRLPVIGHDFGASVAAWCALVRPDVFRSLALMSAPFEGPPALPFSTDGKSPEPPPSPTIHEALAALPRPRKHYQWWYSTRPANAAMWYCKEGVHEFLRAYYHHKSADWIANKPHKPPAGPPKS